MAGAYGSLSSRADFHRALREALDMARWYLAQSSADPVRQTLADQLELMSLVTAPADDDRGCVGIGLIATRELGNGETGDAKLNALANQLTELLELSSFVEGWPTDAVATNPHAEEAMRLLAKGTDRGGKRA